MIIVMIIIIIIISIIMCFHMFFPLRALSLCHSVVRLIRQGAIIFFLASVSSFSLYVFYFLRAPHLTSHIHPAPCTYSLNTLSSYCQGPVSLSCWYLTVSSFSLPNVLGKNNNDRNLTFLKKESDYITGKIAVMAKYRQVTTEAKPLLL